MDSVYAWCISSYAKGVGTSTGKTGEITDQGVYTIVEEKKDGKSMKWGKLKSGKGWIALDGVKKV